MASVGRKCAIDLAMEYPTAIIALLELNKDLFTDSAGIGWPYFWSRRTKNQRNESFVTLCVLPSGRPPMKQYNMTYDSTPNGFVVCSLHLSLYWNGCEQLKTKHCISQFSLRSYVYIFACASLIVSYSYYDFMFTLHLFIATYAEGSKASHKFLCCIIYLCVITFSSSQLAHPLPMLLLFTGKTTKFPKGSGTDEILRFQRQISQSVVHCTGRVFAAL